MGRIQLLGGCWLDADTFLTMWTCSQDSLQYGSWPCPSGQVREQDRAKRQTYLFSEVTSPHFRHTLCWEKSLGPAHSPRDVVIQGCGHQEAGPLGHVPGCDTGTRRDGGAVGLPPLGPGGELTRLFSDTISSSSLQTQVPTGDSSEQSRPGRVLKALAESRLDTCFPQHMWVAACHHRL